MAYVKDQWKKASRKGKGKRWLAVWVDPVTGKEKSLAFSKKYDAECKRDEMSAAVRSGTYIDPANAKTPVATYAADWLPTQGGAETTKRGRERVLRLHVLPVLGKRQIGTIRHSDIQGLITRLEEAGKAESTVTAIYATVQSLFKSAVRDRMIPESPCHDIKISKRDQNTALVPLTTDQVRAIRDALPVRYRALVDVLAGTGERIGEALGNNVEDVDFLRRVVNVERSRRPDGSVGPTKTRKSRGVPVGKVVTDVIAADLKARPRPRKGPLWLDDNGDALTYHPFHTLWKRACVVAGVEATPHDLRHYYASLLIAHGATVKQVQNALGHAKAATTLNTYAHLWHDSDDKIRGIIDAVHTPANLPRSNHGARSNVRSIDAGQAA